MKSFMTIVKSSIFSKWLMAISGLAWVGFLVGHLAANLLIFVGPDALNAYGADLRALGHGAAIWAARLGLLVFFALHVTTGIRLARLNRVASGGKYAKSEPRSSTLASRTMLLSGLVILTYLVYHLAHFTWGLAHSEFYNGTAMLPDGRVVHDVYSMLVASFSVPGITAIYIIGMILVGLHLNHAIASAAQTMGVSHPRYVALIRKGALALSLAISLGFMSVPLSVITGMVK
jgi:succinate dehydrogenase / fumarate reductase cytochrome b subunit